MKPDRSKLPSGTRTEEILKAILLVLDEINEKLDLQSKSSEKLDKQENKTVELADKVKIVSKVSSVDSKTRKK